MLSARLQQVGSRSMTLISGYLGFLVSTLFRNDRECLIVISNKREKSIFRRCLMQKHCSLEGTLGE